MACESGNFTIADLDRKAGYGHCMDWSADPLEAQFDRRAEMENPGSTTIGEAGDVTIGNLHLKVV